LVQRNGARAKDAKELAMLIELDDPEIEDLVQCLADAAVASPAIQAELAELVELAWRNVTEAQAVGLIRITWAEDGDDIRDRARGRGTALTSETDIPSAIAC
jgi:hypothetical protein